MVLTRSIVLGHAILAVTAVATPVSADVVFDNGVVPTGSFHVSLEAGVTDGPEDGNTIALGGVDRVVTTFRAYLRIGDFGPATFDTVLRFYENDGPGGQPGSLIWFSKPIPRLIDSGAPLAYSFAIPDVRLPDVFTWTIQITNRAGNMAPLGPATFAPSLIGHASYGYWRNGDAWAYSSPEQAPFGAWAEALRDPICPADFDESGEVGFNDLIALLALWGPCNPFPVCPPYDLDASGDVGFADLVALLGAWGPCPTVGSCCLCDGSCRDVPMPTCVALDGTYQGDGTDCTFVDCRQPLGACCFADGSCGQVTKERCLAAGGLFWGKNTACDEVDCAAPRGACCLPGCVCDETAFEDCLDAGGIWWGVGATCESIECVFCGP